MLVCAEDKQKVQLNTENGSQVLRLSPFCRPTAHADFCFTQFPVSICSVSHGAGVLLFSGLTGPTFTCSGLRATGYGL